MEFKVGDRVRLVDPVWEKSYGGVKTGDLVTITEIIDGTPYANRVGSVGCKGNLFSVDHPYSPDTPFAVELVSEEPTEEPTEEVFQVGDTVRLTGSMWPDDMKGGIFTLDDEGDDGTPGFYCGGELWIADNDPDSHWGARKITSEEAEAYVNALKPVETHETPNYYVFPGGVEVRQISAHLTSFGGQALQYVARSTRLDGQNKGEAIKDLKKARDFIDWEIDRMEAEE